MQQTTVKNNPFTFYLRMLLYMFTALLLRVVAFAPLVALFAFPQGSPLRWLWVLCPVLVVFLLLPLRYSFADALVQKPRQRRFSFDTALSLSSYGEKLAESLLHALNVIKWGIPLFLMLGYAYYCYNEVDLFTLMNSITAIGKGVTDAWCAVANFFITLFGSIHTISSTGGLMEGIAAVLAVLGVGALIWLYGAVRNSVNRYIWVVASRGERSTRVETRRRMRGRRWRQVLVALVNLVLWTPFLVVVLTALKGVVSDISTQLMMAISQKKLPAVDLMTTVSPMVFAFVCLYMPLLPARRWITAAFATRNVRHTAPVKPVVTPVSEGETSTPEAPVQAAQSTQAAPLSQGDAPADVVTPSPVAPFVPEETAQTPEQDVAAEQEPEQAHEEPQAVAAAYEHEAEAAPETEPEAEPVTNAEPEAEPVQAEPAQEGEQQDEAGVSEYDATDNQPSDPSPFTIGQ